MKKAFKIIDNVAVFDEPEEGHPNEQGDYVRENAPHINDMLIPIDVLDEPFWSHYRTLSPTSDHWTYLGSIREESEAKAARIAREAEE